MTNRPTEVTNGEYDKFLAATDGGSVEAGIFDSGPPDGCAGNATFSRVTTDPATFPVGSVDWCDAHAFCKWAGKRLCGKTIGGDASSGEWFAACTNGGERALPYGNAYDASACNDTTSSLSAVGSFAACQGGVPALFDMNGNVTELIDSCNASTCLSMGGYFYVGMASAARGCGLAIGYSKNTKDPAIGFRCCGDRQ